MDFLELAVDLRLECSVSGVGPVSINDNRAEYQRLIKWIREANAEIQGKYANWRFLWRQGEHETEPGRAFYLVGDALTDSINVYRPDTFKVDGETLTEKDFFDPQMKLDATTYGKPSLVVVQPDNSQCVWPIPDKVYTITYEYYLKPQQMKEAEDIPLIPETWHKIIVYRAMMMYGYYENAPEVENAGAEGVAVMMPQLEANQLPGQRDNSLVNEYDIVVRPC